MAEKTDHGIRAEDRVLVHGREDLGPGEVLRIRESGGVYEADVAFEGPEGRRLDSFTLDRLRKAPDLIDRLAAGDLDDPADFLLKQLAYQIPLHNSGGELSNSRTDLLPHQILLTHDVVQADRRKFLIADEVGLGKTIEAGMIVRELASRGQASRILIICPAGLICNWQDELKDCFRMHFEVLGRDFSDHSADAWEVHNRVIASIDTVKRARRMERLLNAPRWDVIIFDESHHLSRKRWGQKVQTTLNYRLAEALRGQARDLLFLSATPHQGDGFQFWSLVQLLDDQLFEAPEAMLDHRGLLNRVMFRRTKREVTYADGTPIFMRRQVHSQKFPMAAPERAFYDRLTEYLREGYRAAGLGQARTTSRQRAVGFVMATFQKMMSSSPRAIRQALRRRLLVLLARQQMALETEAARHPGAPRIAERILSLQDEMRQVAVDILGLPASGSQRAEADAYIAKLKRTISRKAYASKETTYWALDAEDEGEQAVFAEADIPEEVEKVRELIRVAPEGTDRKFDTLVRAIEQLRRENPSEKFVIFTQYRETLQYLRKELGRIYGSERIATIKGGPLDDKIAAIDSFWQPDGAQFLVSTSAGGEGINLQVCRILFNYDLPWNPMAVEQRIGRIHRYGQTDTAQVYNLVAEDTVEEKIYELLEEKLLQIALTIGRVDPVTGQVVEDFRSEILGFLGSSPNYQELYKKALVDRDYQRTEREMLAAIEKARQASEALRTLTQDLDTFNLQHYRDLQGRFSMGDLQTFVEKAVLRLRGAFLPNGKLLRIETPQVLLAYHSVASRYERATFDRKLAMRTRNADLLGLGHPLVDAVIQHLQSARFPGLVSLLSAPGVEGEQALSVRYLLTAELENGGRKRLYEHIVLRPDGSWNQADDRLDVDLLSSEFSRAKRESGHQSELAPDLRERLKMGQAECVSRFRTKFDNVSSVRAQIVGLAAQGKRS